MNEPLDARIRQLVGEIADAAPPAHDWDEVASTTSTPPAVDGSAPRVHRPLVAAAAIAAVAAAVVAAVAIGRPSPSAVTTVDPTVPIPPSTLPITVPTPPSAPGTTTAPNPDQPAPGIAPVTTPPSPPPPPASTVVTPEGDAESGPVAAVEAYFDALAGGRWTDAAAILGEGGLSLDQRPDLAVLSGARTTEAELADALRAWCASGALCSPPTSYATEEEPNRGDADVVASWDDGSEWPITATFGWSMWEGASAVSGLPPLVGAESISIVAEITDANTLVATLPDGRVVAWTDGSLAEISVPTGTTPWSDGSFVYWRVTEAIASGGFRVRSIAATFDGMVVCELDGSIHRVTQRTDGGFVASVEPDTDVAPLLDDEVAVPNEAVDCDTGESTPIETVSWRREGGWRSITRLSGRTFTSDGDAEGNADVLNEDGISINGDDYAGHHTFSPDASAVVYGVYGGASPHYTTAIRSRDTITADVLWSAELDQHFYRLHHTGVHVLVDQPPSSDLTDPWTRTEYLVVLDAATGERLAELPTAIRPDHLG